MARNNESGLWNWGNFLKKNFQTTLLYLETFPSINNPFQTTLFFCSITVCSALQQKSHLCTVFLFWELRGLSPDFHIHVSVSDLYILGISPHIFLQQNRQIASLTDTWMWKLGLWPRNSFSGNICFEFSVFFIGVKDQVFTKQPSSNSTKNVPRSGSPVLRIRIRDTVPFWPWIRNRVFSDPKSQFSDPGSQTHIFGSLMTNQDPRSGNIPDPQHCGSPVETVTNSLSRGSGSSWRAW